jgi:monoamine oxidase
VIVTVPTTLIADESVRLDPACPHILEAAAGLPLGVANKVFLYHRGRIDLSKQNKHFAGSTTRKETGSYQLYMHGYPIISAYFGGEFARSLEKDGRSNASDFAVSELAQLFGSDFGKALVPLAISEWVGDPWAKGSFSHALPGHAEDRSRLSIPVEDRIFFAGEACHPIYFSSTHGALLTGWQAADAVSRHTLRCE